MGIEYVMIRINAYFLVFIKNKFGKNIKIKIYIFYKLIELLVLLISLNHAMKIAICWFKLELRLFMEIYRIHISFLNNLWKVSKILFIIKKGSGSDDNNDPKKKNNTLMISIIFILKF